MSETMKLLKYKNSESKFYLEIAEAVLVYCNIVNNDYRHDSKVLYTFIPNESFGQLLDILPNNIIFLKTFISKFSYVEVWFTN